MEVKIPTVITALRDTLEEEHERESEKSKHLLDVAESCLHTGQMTAYQSNLLEGTLAKGRAQAYDTVRLAVEKLIRRGQA